jgi:hypothetical protein
MPRVKKVVVTGAGFSAPIGVPVMRGFFRQMQEKYNDPLSGLGGHEASQSPDKIRDRQVVGRVLDAWAAWKRRKNHVDSDDLEAFCSGIGACPDLRRDTSYAIVRICELCMQQEGNKGLAGLWGRFYRPFAKDVGERREHITIMTFNYDLLLDQALLQEGYCPDYRLPGNCVRDVNESQKRGEAVPLLKPHGSINWLVCDDPSCEVISLKWERGPDGCPGNWPTGVERHGGHNSQGALHFVLVPPESKKTRRGLVADWLRMVNETVDLSLEEAEQIFFLGWSAPDTDEDSLMRFRERLTSCRRAWVVNRATGTDDVRSLMDRFYYLSASRFPITYCLGPDLGNVAEYAYATSAWRAALLADA